MRENIENSTEIDFLIPQNVSTKTEIFPGIGWKELGVIAFAIAIGFLFFMILGVPQKYVNKQEGISIFGNATPTASVSPAHTSSTDSSDKVKGVGTDSEKVKVPVIAVPLRMFIVILFAGAAYILVSKANGPSILNMLMSYRRFSNSRKRYYYKSGVY
jgi:hypothetical protein